MKVAPKTINNTATFVDDSFNKLKVITVSGKVGSKVTIPQSQLPDGYRFLYSGVNTFTISALNTNHQILLTNKISVTNTLLFVDKDGEKVQEEHVHGKIGERYDLSQITFPYDEYKIDPSEKSSIVFKKDNETIKIKVVSNKKTNNVIFKDRKGKVINSVKITGGIGRKIDISKYIPENYVLSENQSSNVTIEKDNEEKEIIVDREFVKNTLVFKDKKGNLIGKKEVEGTIGNHGYAWREVPEGYTLVSEDDFVYGDEGAEFEFIVIESKYNHSIYNYISYVDENGKEVYRNSQEGYHEDEFDIPNIRGYEIIGKKKLQIEEDDYLHKVLVKTLKIKNTFTLIDYYTDEKLETVEITALSGSKITNNQIPDKYKLVTGIDVINPEYKEQAVRVKRVVKTNIRYIDSNNKLIGTQAVTALDRDKVKVKVPKGYIQAYGNQYIVIDHQADTYNVLVVSESGATKPTVPNPTPTPNPTPAPKPQSTTEDHKSVVLTKLSMTSLYDKNGKKLNNRALVFDSNWKTNQKMILNGITYYRVATNEYVKATDVVEFVSISSTIRTTSGEMKYLYNNNGVRNKARALAGNTSWYSDRIATINGEKMYRVATNEWVKASNIK